METVSSFVLNTAGRSGRQPWQWAWARVPARRPSKPATLRGSSSNLEVRGRLPSLNASIAIAGIPRPGEALPGQTYVLSSRNCVSSSRDEPPGLDKGTQPWSSALR